MYHKQFYSFADLPKFHPQISKGRPKTLEEIIQRVGTVQYMLLTHGAKVAASF
jgi:hypothetical protein